MAISKNINPIRDLLADIHAPIDVRKHILARYQHLDLDRIDRCYIYGAGQDARDFIHQCQSSGMKILGVFDDDPKRHGEDFAGFRIEQTKGMQDAGFSSPLIITTHRIALAARNLRTLGIQSYVPSWVLQILRPDIFPTHMYYLNWAEDLSINKEKYINLWNLFADDQSRKFYQTYVQFKLSFDPLLLLDNFDPTNEYFPTDIITLSQDEVFVDGGAWTGDTVKVFIERVGNKFKRVYAWEPSPVAFAKLSENFSDDPRVILINKGMYSKSTIARFEDFCTTASRISNTGTIEIPVTSIDEIVGNDCVSYIKMNIEGSEVDALNGAKETIRKNLPKLAICAYHHPHDIWEIPDVLESIVADKYDYYLRLHDGGVIQLDIYAIPRYFC